MPLKGKIARRDDERKAMVPPINKQQRERANPMRVCVPGHATSRLVGTALQLQAFTIVTRACLTRTLRPCSRIAPGSSGPARQTACSAMTGAYSAALPRRKGCRPPRWRRLPKPRTEHSGLPPWPALHGLATRFETVDISPGRGTTALAADSMGHLYVGTSKGLLVSRLPAGASRKPAFSVYNVPKGKWNLVRSIAVAGSGAVWYSCEQHLCRLEGGRVESRAEWGVPNDLWETVAIDRQGNVWARSRTKLIELPRGESGFLRRDRDLPQAAGHGSLLIGADGELWVPTLRGLARRTATGWDVLGKPGGLPISSVKCALQDREGSIWMGLSGAGLVRWLGYPNWNRGPRRRDFRRSRCGESGATVPEYDGATTTPGSAG